jgi:MFS family permease
MGRYREVLTSPGAPALVCAAAIGRLPYGMTGLSLVLLGRAQGLAYGAIGLLVGAYALGAALALPALGRAVDALGERRVLLPVAVGWGVSGSVLLAALSAGAAPGACAAPAFLAGALVPPLGPCMRAIWPRLLSGEEQLLSTAYAFEAAVQEFAFIAGPLLAGALAALASPAAALGCSVACGAVGALWFAAAAPAAPHRERPAHRRRALASAGVRTVLFAYFATGTAFGCVEVAMPAFCEHHGARAAAGIVLAVFSAGSMVGGVWFGTSGARSRALHSYLVAVALLALALTPMLAATSIVVMAAIALLAGAPIAPGFAAAYVLLDELAAPEVQTEVFAWISTCVIVGTALGSLAGGALIQGSGWRAAIGLAVTAAACAAAVAILRRPTLRPAV